MLTLKQKIQTIPLPARETSFRKAKPKERIMIIDDFEGYMLKDKDGKPLDEYPDGSLDINNDNIPELWHGYIVKGVFLSAGYHKDLPEIKEKQKKYQATNTHKIIKNIRKRNNNNNPNDDINIVNMSNSLSLNFERMSELIKTEITSENISKIKDKIIPKLNGRYFSGKKVLSNLAKLTKKVKIYVAVSNEEDLSFNFFSLADGVKSIGGLDKQGNYYYKSAKNSLIGKNDWAPYFFEGKLLKDENNKPVGYDVAPVGQKGDGDPDILLSDIKLSSDNPPDEKIEFAGTSFSSPYKAGKDALARQKGQEEWNPAELYGENWMNPFEVDATVQREIEEELLNRIS